MLPGRCNKVRILCSKRLVYVLHRPIRRKADTAGRRSCKDGDVVKFDAGVNAEFDFYTTDTSRAWIIGNGDPALLKLKDRLYEGQRRMIAAAKPGLPINELYHTAYDYVKRCSPAIGEVIRDTPSVWDRRQQRRLTSTLPRQDL